MEKKQREHDVYYYYMEKEKQKGHEKGEIKGKTWRRGRKSTYMHDHALKQNEEDQKEGGD